MKAKRVTYSIITVILISVVKSYGQTDSTKKKAVIYLSVYLKTDTGTASRVLAVQQAYKSAVTQVMSNTALTDSQRRTAIDSLIDQKNMKLGQLVSAYQRGLLVPISERRRTWQADTTANKTN